MKIYEKKHKSLIRGPEGTFNAGVISPVVQLVKKTNDNS